MYNNKLFKKFCKNRNLKSTTITSYETSLKKYTKYHKKSLNELINEATNDEEDKIPLKDRRLKKRLLNYRTYLLNSDMSHNTVKTYFSNVKTFYNHFEIEIPILPDAKYRRSYETNYRDLPTKQQIKEVLDSVSLDLKAVILFMSSSGTAKAETLSLTVQDFIDATKEYHHTNNINEAITNLKGRTDIIPTFYLRRIKTDKYYYTFCSTEASYYIIKYLKTRKNLKHEDQLFDFSDSLLLSRFQDINDKMGWGFKGKYRFFRSHALRKFHASNIGLSSEYIDSLQGRSKTSVHEAYIKTNPVKLKEIYSSVMTNILIYEKNELNDVEDQVVNQEFTIVVNVFLSGKEYNIV